MVDPGIGCHSMASLRSCARLTSRRVGCGCTVGTFTTLGECGLSLSLGLRPMKTHSSNQEMKSN